MYSVMKTEAFSLISSEMSFEPRKDPSLPLLSLQTCISAEKLKPSTFLSLRRWLRNVKSEMFPGSCLRWVLCCRERKESGEGLVTVLRKRRMVKERKIRGKKEKGANLLLSLYLMHHNTCYDIVYLITEMKDKFLADLIKFLKFLSFCSLWKRQQRLKTLLELGFHHCLLILPIPYMDSGKSQVWKEKLCVCCGLTLACCKTPTQPFSHFSSKNRKRK